MERVFLENLSLEPEVLEAIWQQVDESQRAHQQQLRRQQMEFDLQRAVDRAGGRSAAAIRALLDEQAILNSEDMASAARKAVGAVKREHGYLFQSAMATAPGTGSARVMDYSMEELGSMSLAEYKRARKR